MAQPNQNTSAWSDERVALLLSLREDEDKSWKEIAQALSLPAGSAAPEIKYRRLCKDETRYLEIREMIEQGIVAEEANPHEPCLCEGGPSPDCNCPPGWCTLCENLRPVSKDVDKWVIETNFTRLPYRHDKERDEYVFSVRNQLITIPGESWQKIVELYSAEGANLTQYQIAQKVGINKKDLEACIRAYGHFKARPPVTREALAGTGDDETLVERAIEVRERQFSQKLSAQGAVALKLEVQKLRQELFDRGEAKDDLRSFVQEMIASLGGYASPAVKLVTPRAGDSWFDVHEPLYDPHVGLSAHAEMGWTNDYSSDIALEYIRLQGRQVAERILSRKGWCRTAYFSLGGDFFHAPLGRTESGRPLMRDKPDRLLFRLGCEATIDHIESLRAVSEQVVVKGIGGNHGHVFDELLVDFLAMYYRGAMDVLVDDSIGTRAWFRTGNVLHVIDHGTTFGNVTSEKSLSRADRIARIIAGRDYHGVERVIFYVGHMHHRESKSQAHMEIIRVPVFCHESEYEDFLGFYNDPMADVYFLDHKGRIDATERLYLADGMPFDSKLAA